MKEFRCKDAGHACDWRTTAQDENEVLEKAKDHGRKQHGLGDVKDEQIRPLIHDVA